MKIQFKDLKIGRKYYMIVFGNWFEIRVKKIHDNEQYNDVKNVIFSTKIGDLHLTNKYDKWQWSNPMIFEKREDAILEVGKQLFKGKFVDRLPFEYDQLINIAIKKIPEQLI